jgi:tetratricopeptide (TPR) repeat protein
LIRNGWHYWHRHTREGFEKALCSFQAAARDQGGDFRAYAGVSRCYLMLGTFSMRPPREMYPAFLDAHKKAAELVGLTPDLRADRAQGLHIFERKVAEAESELLKAKRENPRAFGVDTRLAILYAASCRFDDALVVIQEGYAADSLWPILPSAETLIRCWKGDLDGALASGRKTLDLHPYFSLGRAYFAYALELSGHFEEAVAQYRLACVMSPDLFKLRADEAGCLARNGCPDEANSILRDLQQLRLSDYVDAYAIASLLCALGRHEDALDELERAEVENSPSLFMLDADHRMNDLRDSPRFLALRNRVFRNSGVMQAPALRNLITVPNRPKHSNPRHRAAS